MTSPASLSQMQQMVPFMNHPLLRWVVVIKPEQLVLNAESLPIEQAGEICLKNVSSLSAGLRYLRQTTEDLYWHQADLTFFPDPN
jgi:hypothetical protein